MKAFLSESDKTFFGKVSVQKSVKYLFMHLLLFLSKNNGVFEFLYSQFKVMIISGKVGYSEQQTILL